MPPDGFDYTALGLDPNPIREIGEGASTTLSDADLAKLRAQTGQPGSSTVVLGAGGNTPVTLPAGLPAVNLPSVSPAAIDVGGARPVAAPHFDYGAMGLDPNGSPAPPAPPPLAPQMTGIAREAALPASNVAAGLVQAIGTPGDIIRAVGGPAAASELQGNPMPPAFNPGALPSRSAFTMFTPQQIAAAPGKVDVPTFAPNPISSEALLGLTNAAGLTNRPDLVPQTPREKMEAAAAGGVGMMLPSIATGGLSDIPASLRLARAGAGMGVGSEAGGDVGQAVGGTPGRVIGSTLGGIASPLAGVAAGRTWQSLAPQILPTLAGTPLASGPAARAMAARAFTGANITPEEAAALANPPQLVPGSPTTSYQVTGNPVLGAMEKTAGSLAAPHPGAPSPKALFADIRSRQNAAQLAQIQRQAPAIGPGDVVPWFKGKLADLRAAEEGELGAGREGVQGAVEAAGTPATAHEAGGVVRGAAEGVQAPMVADLDARIGAADQAAQERLSAQGGNPAEQTLQGHGERIRGARATEEAPGTGLEGKRSAAKAIIERVYDKIDPHGKLVMGGLSPVSDTASLLRGDRAPRNGWAFDKARSDDLSEIAADGAEDLNGAEASVLKRAASFNDVMKFSDLRKLMRRVSAAQREISRNRDLGRESLPYARMTALRGAIEDALARVVEENAPKLQGEMGFEERKAPLPPPSGPDLFGRERAAPTPAAPEPTIRTDARQEVMPGMGPSAVQAQAARDQSVRGGINASRETQPANEGLFAPAPVQQPGLALGPRVSRWPTTSGANFTDELPQAPPSGQSAAADWVFQRGRQTGNEHIAVVDNRTGEIVHAGTNGLPGKALFDPYNMAGETDAYSVHHNHPNGTAISPEDIWMLAAPGLSHVSAHGHNGVTTVASLAPMMAARRGPTAIAMATLQAELKLGANAAGTVAGKMLRPLVADGKITIGQANQAYQDVANRLLAARGWLNYASTLNLPDAVKTALRAELEKQGYLPNVDDRFAVAIRPEARAASLPQGHAERGVGGNAGSAGSERARPEVSNGGEQGSFLSGSGLGDGGVHEGNGSSAGSESNAANGGQGVRAEPGGTVGQTSVFTPSGRPIAVRYKVVDADSLIPSNADDLAVNPAYPPELQPRDRTRKASQEQVQSIASDLNPERLGRSKSTMEGAPLVGANGVVLSGNGRVLGIRRAYAEHPEQAEKYRAWLEAQGYSTTGMRAPVLVAEHEPMSQPDLIAAAQESNVSPGLAMGAGEKAGVDAGRMNHDLLSLYQPGDVTSAANVPFIRKFMQDVPDPAERGTLQTPDGELSYDGAQRVRNALLMAGYGDPRLVTALSEVGDETIKAFGGALSDAAGDMARLRADIAAGHVEPVQDITPRLLDAARVISQAKQRGVSLPAMVGQTDMLSGRIDPETRGILAAAYGGDLKGRMNRAKLAELLSYYAQEARKQETGPRLFGANLTPDEILAQGIARGRNEAPVRAANTGTQTPVGASYGAGAGPVGTEARGPGGGAVGQGNAATASPEVVPIRPGMPGAEQPGLPGAPPALTPNATPQDIAALKGANRQYQTYKQDFRTGAVGDVLASDARTVSGYKMGESQVPAAVFNGGAKGAEAADGLIRAAGSPEAAMQILGDYPAFSLRKAAEEMGTLSVPKYEKWLAANSAAMDKFPALKAQFDTAAKARAALDDLRTQRAAIDAANPIKPGWGDADVMTNFVKSGPQGYENAARLADATAGSPTAKAATQDYLANILRNGDGKSAGAEIKSGPNAGTLDAGAYQRFMRQYASFLSHPAMADARAAFENVGRAQETLDASAAAHTAAQEAYTKSAAKHFLVDDADPVEAVGKILDSGSARQQMADLARQTAGDPAAREGIQAAIIRAMLKKVESANPTGLDLEATSAKAAEVEKFVQRHVDSGALAPIMTPDQLEALKNVALDMRRGNRAIASGRNTEGSPTAFLTASRQAGEHRPGLVGSLAVLETLGEAGQEAMGTTGRIAAMFLLPVLQAAKARGYANIQELTTAALLHPDKLSALLADVPTEGSIGSRLAAIKGQLATMTALSASRGAQADQPERRAVGQ